MIALGVLRLTWCHERAYLTLPPNNVYVQALAGIRRAVLITLVFDTSKCNDEEARAKIHSVSTQFVGTITKVKRSDGGLYYRASLPLRICRLLQPFRDCVRVEVFIEPASLRTTALLGR